MKNIKRRLYDVLLVILLIGFLLIPMCVLEHAADPKKEVVKKERYVGPVTKGDNFKNRYDIFYDSIDVEIVTVEKNNVPEVAASYEEPEPEYIKVNSTGYFNKYNAHCADGTWPTPGVLAGKREWIGKSVDLYDSEYNHMGTYTFHDVGYGRSIGYGNSKLRKGACLGDIEAGVTIDIFFSTEVECNSYGRKDIYMVWR